MLNHEQSYNKKQLEDVVEQIDQAYQDQKPLTSFSPIFQELPAWQLADLIEVLPLQQQLAIFHILLDEHQVEILSYLNSDVLSDIIEHFDHKQIAKAMNSLASDDAVAILEDLDIEEQRNILKFLAPKQRHWVEEGLSYPDDSAGRIMQREILTMPNFWTVQDAKKYFFITKQKWIRHHNFIFLQNITGELQSIITTTQLLQAEDHKTLPSLADISLKTVELYEDQKNILDLFKNYDCDVVAVVNANNQLVGAIFLHDVLEIAEEEYESDLLNLGGVHKNDFFSDILQTTGLRLPWLIINLGTALISSIVIGNFSILIAGFVSLVTFMPLIASLAGNAGTQSMTVMIRTLSADKVLIVKALNIFSKELFVSIIQGFGIALLLAAISWFYYKDLMLSVTCAISVIIVIILGQLVGIAVPLMLKKLRLDPAVASPVFVTAFTDVSSFAIFLALAAYFVVHL